MTFSQRLAQAARMVDARLAQTLDSAAAGGAPPRLVAAMRHATLGEAKRLRPFLVLECAGLFGVASEAALPTAVALECVHCYSLVHDDLPAMDNDDLRRGKPTVHRAFDEWTAILAGDGLLTVGLRAAGGAANACRSRRARRARRRSGRGRRRRRHGWRAMPRPGGRQARRSRHGRWRPTWSACRP